MPINHPPLGPLKLYTPTSASRSPPPPKSDNNARWRTNLARGSEARAVEAVQSEFVTKILAFMVQSNLDEYKRNNPDFGVRVLFFYGFFEYQRLRELFCLFVFIRKVMGQDQDLC
jgi:syntaxin-binding protein 1